MNILCTQLPPMSQLRSETPSLTLIPPGTPASITTLSVHANKIIFRNPLVFDPERWLGDEGRERRRFQFAFGRGGRICLGIEMAYAELYLLTAALVRQFDMELWETEEKDVAAFFHDYQVAMPELGSQGLRARVAMY